MDFTDIEKAALQLNELYEQLETKRYGRIWTTEELALGFVGDVGDLAKLIQANAGVRTIDDCKAKLGHELSDCLWVNHRSGEQMRNRPGGRVRQEHSRDLRICIWGAW